MTLWITTFSFFCFEFGRISCQRLKGEQPESCHLGPHYINICLETIEKDITDLDLSHRGLTYVPDGAFTKFINLKTVDLSNNAIRYISSDVFSGLSELQMLKLNNNQLEMLTGSQVVWASFLSNIASVHLGMNPFICNCSLTWLRNLLSREEMVLDALDVKCASPSLWNGLLVRDIPTHYDLTCKGSNYARDSCGDVTKFPCTTTELTNVCIPQSKVCDGTPDCAGNGIDESPFVCNGRKRNFEPVPDVMTIQRGPVFNYFNGLLDRFHVPLTMIPSSTLSPAFGSVSRPCRYGAFKCYSDTCIPQRLVCNSHLDCADGADEDVALCAARVAAAPRILTTPATISPTTAIPIEEVAKSKQTDSLPNNSNDPFSPRLIFALQTPVLVEVTTSSLISDFLTEYLNTLNVSLSQQKITETTTEQPEAVTEALRHPTITFPRTNGNEFLNHFMENSYTTEAPTTTDSTEPMSENTPLADFNSLSVPDRDVYQPQNIRLVPLKNNELSVVWEAPGSARAGSWKLVAYSVICEVIRVTPPTKKKKFSPLLSTLVHDYQFHHILPDDSLTVIVKALYEDPDHQRYESVSEPLVRPGYEPTKSPVQVKKEAVAAAQNINYPGKMGFEDLVGISIGGTLAGLMAVLLAIYFYKRRHSNQNHITLKKVHKRTMRMRKLDRTIHRGHDHTVSMEPIYSEPEYALHGLTHSGQVPIRPDKIAEARNDPVALKVENFPDNQYIQVIESDSQYYSCSSHPPGCSEYSCYSIAGKAYALPPGKPYSQMSSSDSSSYAVYDSDNCSIGYYFHNAGVVPRCSHTPTLGNVKRFGDTLTMSHGNAATAPHVSTINQHTANKKNATCQDQLSQLRTTVRNCQSENYA